MDSNDAAVLEVSEVAVVKFVFLKCRVLMEGSCCGIRDQFHCALDQGHKVVSTLEEFRHLDAGDPSQ